MAWALAVLAFVVGMTVTAIIEAYLLLHVTIPVAEWAVNDDRPWWQVVVTMWIAAIVVVAMVLIGMAPLVVSLDPLVRLTGGPSVYDF